MSPPITKEFNFDGLVGPTHNYAGLAPGNLASALHKAQPSNPRAAALQGLDKMRTLHDLGVPQAVLPPLLRPHVELLRRLGFTGDDAEVLNAARRDAPHLLAAAGSASSMWTANAATVSPGADTADGKLHFTAANLTAALHRSVEPPATADTLVELFPPGEHFEHHPPLPAAVGYGDEGAANHTRLTPGFGRSGVEFFVHGGTETQRFTPRQGLQASRAIARLHGLDPRRTVFAAQHPAAIDAGVFHNDVIAVGHRHVLLYHELAFADETATLAALREAWSHTDAERELVLLRVNQEQLPLPDAVASYLFNSQLVTRPDGKIVLIAPMECAEQPATRSTIDRLLDDSSSTGGIDEAVFVDVRQSMHNGGGPACLRLRVELTDAQQTAVHAGVRFTPQLETRLRAWVEAHYRDRLVPDDLADPQLLEEARAAHAALRGVLRLP
ncbi:MAG: N-succinylarginine dihydrolase [Planctomycetota bacterium]